MQADTMLPSAVAFGFAPRGDEIGEQVEQCRTAGHEIVLQVPMEGFGSAAFSLPHRLEVDQPANPGRLQWPLGRFGGYACLSNHLGGRLLTDEGSLSPILEDVVARGSMSSKAERQPSAPMMIGRPIGDAAKCGTALFPISEGQPEPQRRRTDLARR